MLASARWRGLCPPVPPALQPATSAAPTAPVGGVVQGGPRR